MIALVSLLFVVTFLCFSLARTTNAVERLGGDLTNAERRIAALEKKENDRW